MLRFLRIAFVVLPLTAVGSSEASAAAASGCINPADSALSQYCETFPAATGGQTPRGGTPALATTLSSRLARQLASGTGSQADKRRALLTLPAAARHAARRSAALSATRSAGSAATAGLNASTLPPWLLGVLAAVTAALAGAAIARWRRLHRSPPPGETST